LIRSCCQDVDVDMLESGTPARSVGAPRRRLARFGALGGAGTARAVACAAAVALLAAEILPWATLTLRSQTSSDDTVFTVDAAIASGLTLRAVALPGGVGVGFQLGWALLLAAFGAALLGSGRLRRPLAGAAAGLAVGQLALVAAVIGGSSDTKGILSLFGAGLITGAVTDFDGHQGPGMFCAALAALLAVIAAGLVLRERGSADDAAPAVATRHRAVPVEDPAEVWRGPGVTGHTQPVATARRDPWDEDDLGPADLTVTPVPPHGHLRPGP
jgi:hypothetical protein